MDFIWQALCRAFLPINLINARNATTRFLEHLPKPGTKGKKAIEIFERHLPANTV
jgi:hypothetical protein